MPKLIEFIDIDLRIFTDLMVQLNKGYLGTSVIKLRVDNARYSY